MARTFLIISLLLSIALFQAGCVAYRSVEPRTTPSPEIASIYTYPVPIGVYHQVESGQTLWSIARTYGVNVSELMKSNSIKKPQELEVRERLFIPSQGSALPITPLYVSNAVNWKYIIIHHSATDVGSAEAFQKGHVRRGFWQGLGYHFVIDNGSGPTKDGDIEVGRRWFYQTEGAHCNTAGMNRIGIGICLVGNFDQERVSQKQLESLVVLVTQLRRMYNIPLNKVKGHRDVNGASTDCPGNKFPWPEFKKALARREFSY